MVKVLCYKSVGWSSTLTPLASSQHNVCNLYLLLCVQCQTPDDGHRHCPKHVESHSKNKFEKLVLLVGFIIRIMFSCVPWYHVIRCKQRRLCVPCHRFSDWCLGNFCGDPRHIAAFGFTTMRSDGCTDSYHDSIWPVLRSVRCRLL